MSSPSSSWKSWNFFILLEWKISWITSRDILYLKAVRKNSLNYSSFFFFPIFFSYKLCKITELVRSSSKSLILIFPKFCNTKSSSFGSSGYIFCLTGFTSFLFAILKVRDAKRSIIKKNTYK